jgi:hypothetical protein
MRTGYYIFVALVGMVVNGSAPRRPKPRGKQCEGRRKFTLLQSEQDSR